MVLQRIPAKLTVRNSNCSSWQPQSYLILLHTSQLPGITVSGGTVMVLDSTVYLYVYT